MTNEIMSIIVKAVIALASVLITTYLIPYLKEKGIYEKIQKYVLAAEKLGATGAIEKTEKKDYVIKMLKAVGITVNENVEALIETAVEEIDIQVAKNKTKK